VDLLTGVPIDQLDAATRKKLGLPSKGAVSGSGRRKGSRKEYTGPGLPVVCYACSEPCNTEKQQTDHMAATGHHRYQALTQ
jgi:hypothetical protein